MKRWPRHSKPAIPSPFPRIRRRGAKRPMRMANDGARAGVMGSARRTEAARIEFLLQRDGPGATLVWVRRTLAIYRRAVLDHRHFAHLAEFRPSFIASYLELRVWRDAKAGNDVRAAAQPDRRQGCATLAATAPADLARTQRK